MNGSSLQFKNLSAPALLHLRPISSASGPKQSNTGSVPSDTVVLGGRERPTLGSLSAKTRKLSKLWLGRDGYLHQALQITRSLATGIISYSGLSRPAAKVRAQA